MQRLKSFYVIVMVIATMGLACASGPGRRENQASRHKRVIGARHIPIIFAAFCTPYSSIVEGTASVNVALNVGRRNNLLPFRFDYKVPPVLPSRPVLGRGKGVNIYFLDSAIQYDHPDFENRVKLLASHVPNRLKCTKHGTAVAGIALSKTYGIAPLANAYSVVIAGCDGIIQQRAYIAGYRSIIKHLKKQTPQQRRKSIVNVSASLLSQTGCDTERHYLKTLTDMGVTVIAAAGNYNIDARYVYPAAEKNVISVGSLTRNIFGIPKKDEYSNHGPTVDIFAPGRNVKSLSSSIQEWQVSVTGTSFATPFVSGTAAAILSEYDDDTDLSFEDMKQAIFALASKCVRGTNRDTTRQGITRRNLIKAGIL